MWGWATNAYLILTVGNIILTLVGLFMFSCIKTPLLEVS